MPPKRPLFSVVITASNRRENLELVLRSLEAQTSRDFDVCVVDDGSTDGTRAFLENRQATSQDLGLRFVRTGRVPVGVSRARNIGVRHRHPAAHAVVTVDADVVLDPAALERLARAVGDHRSAVAFGVVKWLPDEARREVETALSIRDMTRLHELVPDGPPVRIEGTIVGDELRPRSLFQPACEAAPIPLDPAFTLNTFCAIPVTVLETVGGWNENFVGYGYEDMELGVRLAGHGIRALYVADAVGFHLWHPKPDWAMMGLEADRNLDYVLRRHGQEAISDLYADWSVWWHYHRDRGGAVWNVEGRQYAVNRPRTHALELEDNLWVRRLGHEPADVVPKPARELDAVEVVGPARQLPMARIAYVEPFAAA